MFHMTVQHIAQKSHITPSKYFYGNEEVVYITTKYSFNITSLSDMLERKLAESCGSSNMREYLASHLQRIHVFYCGSSSELLHTLLALQAFISDHPAVNLVFIDDIGTFYWMDRQSTSTSGKMYSEEVAKPLASVLSELLLNFHLAVVVSKPSLFGNKPEEPVEYMPSFWQKMVTHRILLSGNGHVLPSSDVARRMYYVPHHKPEGTIPSTPDPIVSVSTSMHTNPCMQYIQMTNSLYTLFKACNLLSHSKPCYFVIVPFGIVNVIV